MGHRARQPSPKSVSRCNQSPERVHSLRRILRSAVTNMMSNQMQSATGIVDPAATRRTRHEERQESTLFCGVGAAYRTGSSKIETAARSNKRPVSEHFRESPPTPSGRRGGDEAQTFRPTAVRKMSRSRSRNSASLTASSMVIGLMAMASPFLTMCGSTTVARAGKEWTAIDARALLAQSGCILIVGVVESGSNARFWPCDGRCREHFVALGQALAHQAAVPIPLGLVLGVRHGLTERRNRRIGFACGGDFLSSGLHGQFDCVEMPLRAEGDAGARGAAQNSANPLHAFLGLLAQSSGDLSLSWRSLPRPWSPSA